MPTRRRRRPTTRPTPRSTTRCWPTVPRCTPTWRCVDWHAPAAMAQHLLSRRATWGADDHPPQSAGPAHRVVAGTGGIWRRHPTRDYQQRCPHEPGSVTLGLGTQRFLERAYVEAVVLADAEVARSAAGRTCRSAWPM